MSNPIYPDIACLRRIRSLSQFNAQQLEGLAASLKVEVATRGQCLLEIGGCEKFSLYLLEGTLRVITRDQQQKRFSYSDDGVLPPIAQVRPSKYRIVAEGPVRFLRIEPDRLAQFARQEFEIEADPGTGYVEIDQSVEQSSLRNQLFEELMAGKLKLPSLPDVANRIEQAYADNLVTAGTVEMIIQSDPVITAKMIMIVNSALYGGLAPIETLHQAIIRLGLANTRKLVMAYAVNELFKSETQKMKTQMRAVWKHSQHVASLCRLLASSLDKFDADQALLAGLVHDIGEVAILQYAQQHEGLRDNPQKLRDVVVSLRPQVTGMLLRQWKFSPELVTVGEECEEWFRNPSDQPDLCDLVLIAQYHAMIGTAQQKDLPPIAALPAFAKLGMADLGIDQIMEFMQQSRDKIKSIESHLG